MLRELFVYFATACDRQARRLGFLRELVAIDGKYRRVRHDWQPHLENSRKAIEQAVQQLNKKRKVIVLGSGLLLDVPLNFLSEQFSQVLLVDIAHLNKVRRRIHALSNVQLIEKDITGLSGKVLDYQQHGSLPAAEMVIPGYDEHTDLVVSLNLFSQLPVTFTQWLARNHQLEEKALQSWGYEIMRAHLQKLNQLHATVLVIGDMTHQYQQGNQLIERDDFASQLQMPPPGSTWSWQISPPGELAGGFTLQSQVGAWFDWQEQAFN